MISLNYVFRPYRLLADFGKVYDFLQKTYGRGNMLPMAWEYAYNRLGFNYGLTHRFGIWEAEGEIVGVDNYETDLGECYINTAVDDPDLINMMIEHAEKDLSVFFEGKRRLVVTTMSQTQTEKQLDNSGYHLVREYPITRFDYASLPETITLPEGFAMTSLAEENDLQKIHRVLWKGFDHGSEPDQDIDCRRFMQSAPHFRKDLSVIVKAKDGEYACYCGMWVDEVNKYAYVEPLATIPEYRRLGLARAALMEGMRRTRIYNATACYGDVNPFYYRIGFRSSIIRKIWRKIW